MEFSNLAKDMTNEKIVHLQELLIFHFPNHKFVNLVVIFFDVAVNLLSFHRLFLSSVFVQEHTDVRTNKGEQRWGSKKN